MTTAATSGDTPKTAAPKGPDWWAFGDHLKSCRRCALVESSWSEGRPEGYRVRWRLPEVSEDAAALVLTRDEPPATPSRVPCYMVMLLRDDVTLLVPAVEKATLGLPKGDDLAVGALAGAAEALTRLGLTAGALAPGTPETEQWAHATLLARSVNCLRGHLEKREGLHRELVKYCRRCSRPIQPGEPYTEHIIHAATAAVPTVYEHPGGQCP